MNRNQMLRQKQALEQMDVEAAWKIMDEGGAYKRPEHDVMIIAMHKARVELTMINKDLRLESIEWLRARGYVRRGPLPLPPFGMLPE